MTRRCGLVFTDRLKITDRVECFIKDFQTLRIGEMADIDS